MGSKGSNTTTQTQNQTQSYAPAGAGYLTSALDRATSAAAQPFAIPQAPVAGFLPDQMQAFQQYRDAQGISQPYFNQAANYYSPQGAQDFLNPYAANVMANLKDVFGQQTSQNTGKLTQAAGGIGADRIAVGQAELAKQQGLVAGQTLSGMYDNAVRQAQAAGAGQMGLGHAAQTAALTGAGALYGAGSQQQQLEQQQLNAPYQQQLAQAAFPYQQAQFLSGITGSLAPSLGGTTSGSGTSSKTAPAPSLFSQILGGGTAAVGALGGTGAFGSDGWLSSAFGGGSNPWNTQAGWASNQLAANANSPYYGPAFARGGRTDPFVVNLPRRRDGSYGYDDGGAVSDDPIDISDQSIIPTIDQPAAKPVIPQLNLSPPPEQQSGSGSGGKGGGIGGLVGSVAKLFLAQGGRTPYADGGEIDMETPATFDERVPYRMPGVEAVDAWRADAPSPDAAAAPVMAFAPEEAPISPAARAVSAAGAGAAPVLPENPYSAGTAGPAIDVPERRDPGFAASPWAALVSAGLGMMAGTSPFAGVNIGQGGLQGLKTLEAQRAAAQKETTIDQAARRLALEAKHHEDQYSRMTPYQRAQVESVQRKSEMEKMKPVQIGFNTYGQPIFAKRNPKTGEYEPIQLPGQQPAPTAPVAPAPTPGVPPTVPGQDESALPPNAAPTQGLLPNGTFGAIDSARPGTNPEALAGIRPEDANMIRAIAEGRRKFLPLGRNNPYNRFIMEKVHEYDPSADETAFSRRQRTANFFAVGTQGGGGQNITAMNTFGQHAEELFRLSEKLNLGQYPTLNALKLGLAKQGFSSKEIQDTIGAWEVAAKAVADEGAKVFAGTNSALADREEWGKKFDVNNPTSVTKSKLKEVVKLIEGRLNALTNQYNEGMRTDHAPKDFIAPKTREIFDRIVSGKKDEGGGGPKVGERKQFKQGWGRWDGKQWVPEQ